MELDLQSLFGLEGRTVLITGASSGIGLHAARLYSAAGAAVALAARRIERIEQAAAELRALGRRAVAIPLDVTQPDAVVPAFDAAQELLGTAPDVLLNNAGILIAERFVNQKEADVERVFATNLQGAFRVAQEAARRMMLLNRGAIINVGSTSALRNGAFMASYAASKAGLLHLGGVMALELASKGIRVNTLCPGNIETDMQAPLAAYEETMKKRTPLRRFGIVSELDGALLLLASDAGSYMTGAVVTVDGGQALSWM